MSRSNVENGLLRGCPTCGTPVAEADLHLRDFSWVNEALPGRVGLMDIDGVLSCKDTGATLMLEMKPPGATVSNGALLTFREFVKRGYDVWVLWGPYQDGTIKEARVRKDGSLTDAARRPAHEVAADVRLWWDEHK